jgi:hypothetical protein
MANHEHDDDDDDDYDDGSLGFTKLDKLFHQYLHSLVQKSPSLSIIYMLHVYIYMNT